MNEDPMARMLADAGARTAPPAGIETNVRRAVHQAWIEETVRRRQQQLRRRWLAAAGVLLVLGSVLAIAVRLRAPDADAGIFLASRGAVNITSGSRQPVPVGGSALIAGTRIRTGADGVALLAMGGASLRVGPDSDLSLLDTEHVRLERGRVFLDFGAHALRRQDLLLQTPLGEVEHLGTQYQVQLGQRQMSVMVREGRVRISTADGEQLLGEHEAAEVEPGGRTRVHAAPAFGAAWAWANELRPDFPIEGVTLAEFLDWFARETGRQVQYASPAARAAAQATRLSGSIAGLSPQGALIAVIASTQFALETLEAGELRLELRNAAGGAPHAKLAPDGAEVLTSRTTSSN